MWVTRYQALCISVIVYILLLIGFRILQLTVVSGVKSIIPYPGDDASLEELVGYYRFYMYTVTDILALLLFRHHIVSSRRSVTRILERLNIRMRGNQLSLRLLTRAILHLHEHGHSEAGYKTIWRVLNVTYGLRVTQRAVRTILQVVDPEGVRRRTAHRFRRRAYHGHGPNGVIHIDGYDKLKPFGIAIHGAICGYSRKILWLQACPSNNDPRRVAHYFIDYLRDINGVPRLIRTDAGTENVEVQAIQITLRLGHNDDMSGFRSVGIGRSTANQRIEMLWAILRRTVTQYWRNMFISLVNDNLLNNTDPIHLECIRLCFLPVVQRHLDIFTDTWNHHRMRSNRTHGVLTGIPNNLYHMPFLYGTVDYAYPLPCTIDELNEMQNARTEAMPFRGCSEEFLTLIERLAGINRFDLDVIDTPEKAKIMYEALLELINMYDNWW